MNISFLTIIVNALSLLPLLQQDVALEIAELKSSDDGVTKIAKTIAVLEDLLTKLKGSLPAA